MERVMFIQDITINTVIGDGLESNSDRSIKKYRRPRSNDYWNATKVYIRDELCYPELDRVWFLSLHGWGAVWPKTNGFCIYRTNTLLKVVRKKFRA